ncbi:MAG: hypothetical protein KAI24_03365, partial [Planctomycetes bacterium]|nr:hypothetical protein [Planctomycetota bacterium]
LNPSELMNTTNSEPDRVLESVALRFRSVVCRGDLILRWRNRGNEAASSSHCQQPNERGGVLPHHAGTIDDAQTFGCCRM